MVARIRAEDAWDSYCSACYPDAGESRTHPLNPGDPLPAEETIDLREQHGKVFHDGNWASVRHVSHKHQTVYCKDCGVDAIYEGYDLLMAREYRRVHNEAFHPEPEPKPEDTEVGPPAS